MVSKKKLALDLYNLEGAVEKTIDLPKEIFSVSASKALLAQYVRVYLANQRQGRASAKTRGQVSGSTKKIYRQKGTGRARHGDRKAPIFVGGGVVGGPTPRDYSLRINKKQKKKALFGSLTLKLKEGAIIGLADSVMSIEPKTKHFIRLLKAVHADTGGKMLLVLPKMEKNALILSARNIENLELTDAFSLNPYMILRTGKILMIEAAGEALAKHFLKQHEN